MGPPHRRDLLSTQDPAELSAVAEHLGSEILDHLDVIVPSARKGNLAAVRSYVREWRSLRDRILSEFDRTHPDIVVKTESGVVLVDVKGRPSRHLTEALDQEVLHAPFSVWVQALGDGRGIAVHMITAVRRLTGRAPPVPLPEGLVAPLLFAQAPRSLEPARFLRLAYRELESERAPLDRVADLFGLTGTDLGKLFGVSRQRIAQWREQGVPAAHQPKLNAIARIADSLERNLVPERIPGIVRTAAPAFGKRTLLDQIEQNRHEDALRRVEDSFDWAKTA